MVHCCSVGPFYLQFSVTFSVNQLFFSEVNNQYTFSIYPFTMSDDPDLDLHIPDDSEFYKPIDVIVNESRGRANWLPGTVNFYEFLKFHIKPYRAVDKAESKKKIGRRDLILQYQAHTKNRVKFFLISKLDGKYQVDRKHLPTENIKLEDPLIKESVQLFSK